MEIDLNPLKVLCLLFLLYLLFLLPVLLIPAASLAIDSTGDPAGAVGDPDRSAIVREEPILYFSWLQSGDFTRMINLGFNVSYTPIAANLNLDNLRNYAALIIFATPSGKITEYADDIEAFVDGGGSLFIHQPNKIGLVDYAPTGFEIEITNSYWCPFGAYATIIDHSHPLT